MEDSKGKEKLKLRLGEIEKMDVSALITFTLQMEAISDFCKDNGFTIDDVFHKYSEDFKNNGINRNKSFNHI